MPMQMEMVWRSRSGKFCLLLPTGFSENDFDCDDTIAISPDADEICDSLDNDCDGLIDDSDALF